MRISRMFEIFSRCDDDAGPFVSFVRGDVGEAFGSSRSSLSIKKKTKSEHHRQPPEARILFLFLHPPKDIPPSSLAYEIQWGRKMVPALGVATRRLGRRDQLIQRPLTRQPLNDLSSRNEPITHDGACWTKPADTHGTISKTTKT